MEMWPLPSNLTVNPIVSSEQKLLEKRFGFHNRKRSLHRTDLVVMLHPDKSRGCEVEHSWWLNGTPGRLDLEQELNDTLCNNFRNTRQEDGPGTDLKYTTS